MFGSTRKPEDYSPETTDKYGDGRSKEEGLRISGAMIGVFKFLFGLLLGAVFWTYHVELGPDHQIVFQNNVFGKAGASIAELFFYAVGIVAWLIPALFIWWGIYRMCHKGRLPGRLLYSGVILVVCACIMAGGQQIVGVGWANEMGVPGLGGYAGFWMGQLILVPYLGTNWTVIIFSLIYIIALIYVTGLKPYPFIKAVWRDYVSWKSKRSANESWTPDDIRTVEGDGLGGRLGRPRDWGDPAVEETPQPVRTTRKPREKKQPDQQVALPLPMRPEPQIIDGTQPKLMQTAKSPSVLDLPLNQPSSVKQEEEKPVDNYKLPELSLLSEPPPATGQTQADKQELLDTQQNIIKTLASFGIDVTPGNITRGPTITRYEIYPGAGLRVARITNLSADIARATKAERINILAPIPGKDTVGIEIANNKKVPVPLRELLSDPVFTDSSKRIPLALGKDVYGHVVVADLAAMPHLLVAGATGSGKSVCINSIISSILFKFKPEELKFILVDPKVVEMQGYAKLPHLIVPVVTEPKKVIGALRWAVNEMERRYRIFADAKVRNFESYNNRPREEKIPQNVDIQEEEYEEDPEFTEQLASSIEGEGYEPAPRNERGGTNSDYYDEMEEQDELGDAPDKFPYIVIIIDELADLMQTVSADIETCISRLAAKARAAGIHLIVATQTPRADVVTGVIRANIPCRIAFQVASALDSRIILEKNGAENLVGKGDLYYLPPGSAKLERAQGAFISDEEVEDLVGYCSAQAKPSFKKEAQRHMEGEESGGGGNELSRAEEEDLLRCMDVIRAEQKASVSFLQRRLKFGYNKAARLMDILEARGIVGPSDGSAKPREVYIK